MNSRSREKMQMALEPIRKRMEKNRPAREERLKKLIEYRSVDIGSEDYRDSTAEETKIESGEQENRLFLEITSLLENNQWEKAYDWLEKIGEKNILSADFYMQLNEFLIDHEFPQDDNFELDGFARIFFSECLEKIATMEKGAEYLLSLFDNNKVSDAVLTSFGSIDFIDAEPIVSCYNEIAEAILKTGDPRAEEYVSYILAHWDKKAIKFCSQQPLNIEEKRKREKMSDQLDEENYRLLISADDDAPAKNTKQDGQQYYDQQYYIDQRNYFIDHPEEINVTADSDIIDISFGSQEKRGLLDSLGHTHNEKVVDNLVEFIKNDENASLFLRQVSDIINNIAPERAINKLLNLLKSENEFTRRDASAVLHRLEFGRIGISEEGVRYLEKIYDLGELNNPNYHVGRLTADGEMGLFDEELKLIKFFELGDLSSPEKKVKAKVLDFAYETLFVGQENETPEQREKRLQYLEEFKQHYYEIAQDRIFTATGVKLNNLSFKEQGWFVIYFNEADEGSKERLREFVAKHGEEGIKTFLALESGEKNGEVILELGEKLDQETGRRVFGKFNELSSFIKSSNEELSREFFNDDKTIEPHAEILKRANQALIDSQKNLPENMAGLSEGEKKKIFLEIRKKLNAIKKETAFFTACVKTAYKELGEIDFEELRSADYCQLTGKDITDVDLAEMKRIYEENYQKYPPGFRQKLIGAFERRTNPESGKASFDILKYRDEVVGFLSFEGIGQLTDGRKKKYFGSFNLDQKYTNAKLGEVMLKKALDREAPASIIEADCDPQAPITKKYLENGFVAINYYDYEGVPSFKIIRDDELNNKLESKKISLPEITRLASGQSHNNNIEIQAFKPGEQPTFSLLGEGLILTQYITDKETGIVYCVYEKVSLPLTYHSAEDHSKEQPLAA
ncbi:hypothetical protein GYA54_02095 [Candidatus Kuenenbacteria bacterium]|nr:hypothetical protein [Candidatus Kuenenbacteria bacterium]